MRKAIIATLSVLIVLLFIACNTRVNYNKYLIAIDSLIVQQPDTALSMLEAFPTNSLQTQADSAYYGLLMTEARDKNYIIQTNDSLIQSALTYYNGTNDIEKRARAHYYSGCVYRDSQRRTESMTQYLIAKPLAEKAGERRLLSLIYLNIGYLYYSQNLNTQADSSYQLAQQIGIQLKDSVLQAEVLSRRGLIRMEKGEEFYPEAEKMMLKALAIVQKQSNIQLKENVFSSLCQLYNWMENGEKAIEFAKQNLGVQKDRTTCYKAFELLGSAYYLILQYDSARHYLQKSLFTTDYATKAGAYMYLADIAKEQGDLATSLEMERNYSAYLDSMQKSRQPDAIVCAEQGMPSNKQNIISKHTHYSIISISIITLTLIVAVIILPYKKRKQKPNNRTEKEMLYKAGLVLFEQSDVYDAKKRCFRKHIIITEKKTGKENRIAINSNTKMGLQIYLNSLHYFDVDEYIFAGQKEHSHLCRSQAFRIVKQAAQSLNMEDRISCHSMRKTFGYYAWKYGTQPAVLMDIYNHSSYEITKRYLGIKQDDKDSVFLSINL